MVMSVMPELISSRTVCSMTGLVADRQHLLGDGLGQRQQAEPMPAAGMTALRMVCCAMCFLLRQGSWGRPRSCARC